MIAIASSAPAERAALAALCQQRGWNSVECRSLRDVIRITNRILPKVLVVRFQLEDGHSDDAIAVLSGTRRTPQTKIIVLIPAGTPSSIEARQLNLGADCVQRDPIRADVLLAYIDRFRRVAPVVNETGSPHHLLFLGATLNALDRTLLHCNRTVVLTPREVTLIEILTGSSDDIITYEVLYSEILGRRFRGDTSNMRVLLAKLSTSADQVGLSLRRWVEVIPKTGYRYHKEGSHPRITDTPGANA